MLNRTYLSLICISILFPLFAYSQDTNQENEDNAEHLSLQQCLQYAMKNQPALKQSLIDETIARTNNEIGLSGWLPQVGLDGTLTHYFTLPTSFIPNTANPTGPKEPFQTGVYNTTTPELTANQTIFNTDVLIAARAAHLITRQAKQNTASTKITLVSDVSKAFYDLLLSTEQIKVFKEDTARLDKNLSDTYHQYISGIVDKVDYKQATIALNNSLAQLKGAMESVTAKYATLKQYMGYPADKKFVVDFDTTQMMQEIYFDTTEELVYEKRIEFQQLQTSKYLQRETTAYYQLGFIPSLSAFYTYNNEYENDKFSDLFGKAYPYSFAGLQFSVPLFQGFRRLENIKKSRLQEKRQDWDEVNLKLMINAEYKLALANYKSNLYNLHEMEDNVSLATEVYNIVKLQYRQGIKPYLDVITAEADLKTSEINYLNALFNLLSSKIDLEQAMGDISPTL